MYSDRFFKENDALKEFMTLCIQECDMIPEISSLRYSSILTLSKNGISIGVEICSDPVCIKISHLRISSEKFSSILHCYKSIVHILSNLIECAKKYNIVLGVWASSDDLCIYKQLGFRIIEKYDRFWMEYSQLLN